MPNITLLFGGRSAEHWTSTRMYEYVRESLLTACPDDLSIANVIGISPHGRIRASGPVPSADLPLPGFVFAHGAEVTMVGFLTLLNESSDFVFSMLQGHDGEDGALQGVSQFLDCPINAGSALSAGVMFDKFAQLALAQQFAAGALVPLPTLCIPCADARAACVEVSATFGHAPVILKPNAAGGGFKVVALDVPVAEEITRYAEEVAPFDDHFLVQERVVGVELTVGVVCRSGAWQWLPVYEVAPMRFPNEHPHDAYGEPERPVPRFRRLADDDPCGALVLHAARKLAPLFRDESFYRFDFIVGADGGVRFLEIGSRPTISADSVFAAMLRAAGIDIPDLIRIEFENQAASRAFRRQRFARLAEWVCANR